MSYEMKIKVEITKDGEFNSSTEQIYGNLDYSNLVMLEDNLVGLQQNLVNYAKDKAQKGKK